MGLLRHGRFSGEGDAREGRLPTLRPEDRPALGSGEARHREDEGADRLRAERPLGAAAATGTGSEPLLSQPQHRCAALGPARRRSHDLVGGRLQRLSRLGRRPGRGGQRLRRAYVGARLGVARQAPIPAPRPRLPPRRVRRRHHALLRASRVEHRRQVRRHRELLRRPRGRDVVRAPPQPRSLLAPRRALRRCRSTPPRPAIPGSRATTPPGRGF